jgi:hypothetical protein
MAAAARKERAMTVGRPPSNDDRLVADIVMKLGNNVKLSTALAKFCKADKTRLRPKIRKRMETILKALEPSENDA